MTSTDLSGLGIDRRPSTRPRRSRRRRIWLVAVLLALAVAAGAGARYRAPVSVETTTVTTAYPSQALTILNASGYVVARRKAAVASKATGRLEWLGVIEGSSVKRGEIIARLESRDVAAAREQAAANLMVARADLAAGEVELLDAKRQLRRAEELVAKRFIADSDHDAAVARLDKAQAAVHSLEARVAVAAANLKVAGVAFRQTEIRAPFDGVVLIRHANVGDNITPFSNAVDTRGAVVTIADMSTLEVEADVSESSLSEAKVGQPVEILLDAIPGRRFAGVVNRIVPTVDRAKATVLVKVKFLEHDARVLPEMSAKVAFLCREPSVAERKPLIVVPETAVVERRGTKLVYVVADDRAQEIAVQTGHALGDLLELHGVTVGDEVVLNPLDRIADGVAVRVQRL